MAKAKPFPGAPFGSQSDRFSTHGIHPKRKMPGTFISSDMSSTSSLGPGSYEIAEVSSDFSSSTLEKKASRPNWKRAYELERMATMPNMLYKEKFEELRAQKTKLGPGSYEIADFESVKAHVETSPVRGSIQNRGKRFEDSDKFNTPAPGIYGIGGIPHALKEEMDAKRKSASNVGYLNANSSGDRSLPSVGCHLAPGTYSYKDTFQELTHKVTGLRGPYDLTTGDRSKVPKAQHNLGPGQYNLASFSDELGSSRQIKKGKFLKAEQYPARPLDRIYWMSVSSMPADPNNQVAPGSYDQNDQALRSKSFLHKSYGFLSGSQRQDRRALSFFTGNFNSVGAGRYDIERIEDSRHINAHKNVFTSKTSSRPNPALVEAMRERLRDTNIPAHRREFISHYATEEAPSMDLSRSFKSRSLTIM